MAAGEAEAQESWLVVEACCKGLASSGMILVELSCMTGALHIV